MKINQIACLFVVAFIGACAHKPAELSLDESPHMASHDYEAVGDSTGIRPFVYGKHTLIKFEHGQSFSPSIKDKQGVTVNYKVRNGYHILDRKLDAFTLSGDGHLVRFNLIPPQTIDIPERTMDAVNENDVEIEDTIAPPDTSLIQQQQQKKITTSDLIYAIMYTQMQEQRKLLRIASDNPQYTGDELFKLNTKLNDIEYKIMEGNRAIVHVYFPFNNTVFNPEHALVNALLPLAKDAARINLYGRTDSKIADNGNKIIANGRISAAKDFLVMNGISESIIKTSWRASGDFIAPSGMEEGRRLNRRVTIEIIPN